MRVERCMVDDKKNKILRKDSYDQGFTNLKCDKQRDITRRQAPDVQQQGSFKTRSPWLSNSRTSYGRGVQRQNEG